MRLIKRKVVKDGSGKIKMVAENPEDFWHLYNLLEEGDSVTASTWRKVKMQKASGASKTKKERLTLTIKVEKIDFQSEDCKVRVTGRNTRENKHVKLGAYHTMEIMVNSPFELYKDSWDALHLERVDDACNPEKSADVVALLMQNGLANLLIVTENMSITKAKIQVNMPGKRIGSQTRHEKAVKRFYTQCMEAVRKNVNWEVVQCLVIGSPGFLKDDFFKFMMAEAVRGDYRDLMDNKSKFLLVHSSSGHKNALNEILTDPNISLQLADTKASRQSKAVESFYKALNEDDNRATYGFPQCVAANESQAIDRLLMTDKLFRAKNVFERKKYVALVESVKGNGGEVFIFSSAHASGQQLGLLSGIAATLRFPMPDLLDLDDSEDSSDSSDDRKEDGRKVSEREARFGQNNAPKRLAKTRWSKGDDQKEEKRDT